MARNAQEETAVGELRPSCDGAGQSARAARSPESQLFEAIAHRLSFSIYCLFIQRFSYISPLWNPSGRNGLHHPDDDSIRPPKKRTVALCFLEFSLLTTPPHPPPLFAIALHSPQWLGCCLTRPRFLLVIYILFSLLSYLIEGCPGIKGTVKQTKRTCLWSDLLQTIC